VACRACALEKRFASYRIAFGWSGFDRIIALVPSTTGYDQRH
jgi:hypothetical protein